jgi:mono/diheme cytochrome c family protein
VFARSRIRWRCTEARRLRAAFAATILLAAGPSSCARHDRPATPPAPSPYLTDAAWRRAALVASLVNPSNEYSMVRLAHYDSGDKSDWSRLPMWNPRAEPVTPAELDAPGGALATAPLDAGARPIDTKADLLAQGEDAFFHYPAQLARAQVALSSRPAAARHGLWVDEARGVGGIVRAEMADGSRAFAFTCATCHVRQDPGGLVVGVGNERLDVGRMLLDGSRGATTDATRSFLTWGPGRVDVTTAVGSEPVRIPDLRPTRWLTHLQHGGAVRQRDVETLAIRLETLIITSNSSVVRPPREIALALATYVWSLAGSLPERAPKAGTEQHGAWLFASRCADCHAGDGYTGAPVPLAEVGTDPALGRSSTRGTGGYRVPSLRGVSSRGMLLHDASLPGIEALFDPARLTPEYAGGRRPGAVPGHTFGLDLPDADRADLLAFLRTL